MRCLLAHALLAWPSHNLRDLWLWFYFLSYSSPDLSHITSLGIYLLGGKRPSSASSTRSDQSGSSVNKCDSFPKESSNQSESNIFGKNPQEWIDVAEFLVFLTLTDWCDLTIGWKTYENLCIDNGDFDAGFLPHKCLVWASIECHQLADLLLITNCGFLWYVDTRLWFT